MEQLVMNFEPYSTKTLHVTKYDSGDVSFIGIKEDGTKYDGNIDWYCVQEQLIKGLCNYLCNFYVYYSWTDISDERDMLIGYANKSCFDIMFKKDSITEFGFSLSDDQVSELLKFLL